MRVFLFYLINPLVCIQSPTAAFTASLFGCYDLPAQALMLRPGYSHSQNHAITGHHTWTLVLTYDSLSHAVPLAVTGFSLCLDSDTLLWTIGTIALFPTMDTAWLYLPNNFGIKILSTGRHLYYIFNWSIQILWAFRRRKCSIVRYEEKEQKTGFLFSRSFSG